MAETIDDVIGRCPTAAEMDLIDAVISLSFEGTDPSAPTLVCHAAGGSRDLTKLKRNVYNILLAAKKIRYSQPLPWSSQTSVWDWLRFESGINMIRLRGDIGGSYCCEPSNAIDLSVAPNSYYAFSDKWVDDNGDGGGLVSSLALVVHEARHRMSGGHTCGTDDQTLDELGAWGAQIYFYLWLDRYADRNFLRPNAGDANYYRSWHVQQAESQLDRICQPPATVAGNVVEFYNSVLDHYFMTISPAEATAIDNGSAGPGLVAHRGHLHRMDRPESGAAPRPPGLPLLWLDQSGAEQPFLHRGRRRVRFPQAVAGVHAGGPTALELRGHRVLHRRGRAPDADIGDAVLRGNRRSGRAVAREPFL